MSSTEIEQLLTDIGIKQWQTKEHKTGGISYFFRLGAVNYNLFTSCWNDYGIHICYQKKSNGKLHQMKMLDFEKDLINIGIILATLSQCKPNKITTLLIYSFLLVLSQLG